jgi:hypothetical protein
MYFTSFISHAQHCLPPNSVIVMDNAPYHSRQLTKIPNTSSRKTDIQDFFRGILRCDFEYLKHCSVFFAVCKIGVVYYKKFKKTLKIKVHTMFLPSQFLSKCNYQFANAAINLRYFMYINFQNLSKILSYNTTSSQRLSNIFVVVSRMVIRFMNTMSA